MKHTILHKTVKRKAGAPPCHLDDYYSVDGGESWMSRKSFYKWKVEQFDIVSLHLYNPKLLEAISTSGREELVKQIAFLNNELVKAVALLDEFVPLESNPSCQKF